MRRVSVLVMVTVAAMGVAAIVGTAPTTQGGPPSDDATDAVLARAAGLQTFDACDPLVEHLRTAAAQEALVVGRAVDQLVDVATEEEGAAGAAMAADGDDAAAPAPAGTSDTNVQVAGVDELDLVETDGRRVFTVLDGRLHVVDVTAAAPAELADVALGVDAQGMEGELLLHDDRLLVVVRGWAEQGVGRAMGAPALRDAMPMGSPVTTLVLFDVAADDPVEVARLDVEGELVAGRGVDGTAHLVVAHRPQPIGVPAMEAVWAADGQVEAQRRMADALASTRPSDWLPAMAHRDAAGTVTSGPALDCVDVARPVDTADVSMLQVVTVDLHGGDVMPEATTAVLTDARSVTATADQLVVATPVWPQLDQPVAGAPAVEMIAPAPGAGPGIGVATRLHLFDLGPAGAVHRASGEVPGALLNQFSMSLHGGHLRVATTADDGAGTTESGVTVLRRTGDRLEVVGAVGGLGRGETIRSVRFLGEQAYVVTFRQTDPLYTIDLSDPAAPTVTGELKITGYSAYLHPLGEGRLLGVGQEATLQGQVTGTQVSVFDVTDPAAPTRVSQVLLPGSASEAEWDHHAVLVHDGLVVLPYERWGTPTPDAPEGYETAAVVIARDGDRLELRGTVAGSANRQVVDPWAVAVRRALVVDGRLVTVSRSDVQVHDPIALTTDAVVAL